MNQILQVISKYNIEFILGLTAFSGLMLILNLFILARVSKITSKYNKLVRGTKREDLEKVLLKMGEDTDSLIDKSILTNENIKEIENKLSYAIQKIALKRYDAFDELGSEQSFSIALLDHHNSGLIMTSIFGRDYSSSYIKPINNGKSEYNLSKEEEDVLSQAIGK